MSSGKRLQNCGAPTRSSRRRSFFRKTPKEVKARLRYSFADQNRGRWPMKDICRVLEVSVSGYYRWVRRKDRPTRDEILSAAIKDVLGEHPWNDNYGVRRMQLALAQHGVRAGIRRLTRLMRENGWLHERKRRPKGLTKADLEAMKAENLINQDFSSEEPFRKLLMDITQVQCADGKLYISPILDCLVCDRLTHRRKADIIQAYYKNRRVYHALYRREAHRDRHPRPAGGPEE